MPSVRRLKFFLLAAFFLFSSLIVWGQSNIPAESANWLQQASTLGTGSTDLFAVFFFEIPSDAVDPNDLIYIGVNDAGSDGVVPDQNAGSTDFYLFGGDGVLTDSTARQRNFANLTQASSGVYIDSFTADNTAAYNITGGESSHWTYFSGIKLADGETIGSKVYFKVVVDAAANGGNYKNAFQLDISRLNSGIPTQISGVRSFAYSWPIYNAERNGAAVDWTIYPFVSNSMDTEDLGVHGWDFDSNGNTGNLYNKSTASVITGADLDGGATNYPADATEDYVTITTFETNGSWMFELFEGSGSGYEDAAEIFFSLDNGSTASNFDTNDGVVRAYSAALTLTAPDSVAVNAEDGVGINDSSDLETVTLQILDANGTALPYSMSITVNVDGNATISYVNGVDVADAQSQAVTTDADGLATVGVIDGTAETVTVSVTVFASPNETADIDFVADPLPTLRTSGNTSINLLGTVTLPSITITEEGPSTIDGTGTTERLQVAIPSSLDATFVGGQTFAAGTIGVDNSSIVGSTILTMDPAASFANGDTIVIDNLQITAGGTESSGYLELSYDNGVTWNVIDTALISTVSVTTNSYIWTGGGFDGDFSNNVNWSPVGIPNTTADSIYIPGGLGSYPDLDSGGGVSPTVGQVIIEAGATFDVGAETFTIGNDLFIDGAMTVGTGTLSVGDDTSGSGSIDGGTGSVTFTGDLLIDTYTATSGTTSVGGDFAPTTFTHSSGTVQFNGTGAQSVTSGGNAFNTMVLNKTGGSITFNDALTISTGLSVGAGVAFDLSFNADTGGQTSSIAGNTTLSNTGTTTFGSAAGDSITFTGGLTATAGVKSLAGSLLSEAGVIDLDTTALTLTATTAIDATSNGNPAGANITVGSITGGFDLTVNGGTGGTVSSTATWGAATDLASLNLDAAGFTQGSTVEAAGLIDIAVSAGLSLTNLISSTGGNVNITSSGGSITDGSGAETALVSGATVSLNAVSGAIGAAAAGDVEVTITTALNADTSTAGGDIYLSTTAAMPLGVIDAGTGSVILDSAGAVTDADGTADISGSVGTITAAGAVSADTDLTSLSVTTSAAGAIDISEADNITLTVVTANSGTIDVVSVAGNITVVDINDVSTISRVTLNAFGSIDDGAAAAEVISTRDLRLTAGSGITDLNVDVSNLAAETDTGNLSIIADNAINVTTVDTVAGITLIDSGAADSGAVITIQSGSTVTLTQPIINNDAGDITCTASTGNIIDNTGGETALFSGAAVNLNAVNGAIGGAGVLDIEVIAATELNGDTATGGGDIYLQSIGNLPVGLVTAGAGNISVTSSGTVLESANDVAADFVGASISLASAGNIGGANILETDATDLSITASVGTLVTVTNTNAAPVALNQLSQPGGTLTFSQTGGGLLNIPASADIDSSAVTGGDIFITGANGIVVDSAVNSFTTAGGGSGTLTLHEGVDLGFAPTLGAGDIDLDGSSGAVVFSADITISGSWTVSVDDDIDIAADITAAGAGSNLTLISDFDNDGSGGVRIQAAGSITAGQNISIEGSSFTAVPANAFMVVNNPGAVSITAGVNGAGTFDFTPRFWVADTNVSLADGIVSTSGGAVSISSYGDILLSNAESDITSNGALVTLAADSDGNNTGGIDMSLTTSVITAGAGGITFTADDDILLGTLSATGGAVSVTSVGGNINGRGDDGVADISGATISLTSTAGSIGNATVIDVTGTTSVAATAGTDISFDSIGDLLLGAVSAPGGTVIIDSTGDISDANGALDNVTSSVLTLTAVDDIGDISGGTGDVTGASTDALETAVSTLSATATGAGSEIAVDNTGTALAVSVLNPGNGSTGYTRITNDLAIDVNAMTIGNADNLGLVSSASTLELPDAAISTTGILYFSAAGDISDNTDTLLSNNTWAAGTLYFYGTGNDESISTNITNLTASMSGAADLTITETNGISLTSVVTANGSITVSAAGAISAVLVDSSAVSNDANDITLTSTGAGISVTEVLGGAGQLNDVILDAQGGAITDNGSTGITGNVLTADAAGSITVVAAVDNADLQTSAAGNISVTETDNITLTLIEPNNGDVSITASGGNITVVDINDIAGTNQVALTASGTIDDGVAAAEVISAQTLALTAGTGITDLNIAVGTVGAETDTGNLTLIETDALVIGTVATVTGVTLVDSGNADAGAAISIQAGTGITFNQAVVNNDAGDITVSSTAGSLIDGTGTETALVNGATVTLNAVNGAIGGAGVLDIEVTAATALNGDTSTGGGDIYLQSIGNLPVGLVDAGAGNISVSSSGTLLESVNDGAADFVGSSVIISAAGDIGGANILETDATDISLSASAGTLVTVTNTNAAAVDLNQLSQPGGILTFNQTGGGLLNIPASADIDSSAVTGGDIFITGANGIVVDSAVNSFTTSGGGGGTLTLHEGVDLGFAPTLGAGDIDLDGSSGAVVFSADITISGSWTVSVDDDIDIAADITAAGAGSNLTLISDFDNDGSGGVRIQAAGSITAGQNISIEGSSFTTVPANAFMVVNNPGAVSITAGVNGAGTFDFTPRAPVADTDVSLGDGIVSTSGGAVSISSYGDILLSNAESDITSNGALVTLAADSDGNNTGGIDMSLTTSVITAGAGGITFTADDDILLGTLSATGGAVSVTSVGGNINGRGDDGVADISGATISLTSTAGSIGNATVIDVTGTTSVAATAGTDISFDSIGDLLLGAVSAPGGTVIIDSTGDISDANGALDNVTSSVLTLTAVDDIGDISGGTGDVTGASTDALETAVSTLSATATGAGSEIAVDNTGTALAVSVLNPGNGSTGYTRITNDLAIDVNAMTIGNADNLGLVSSTSTLELPDAAISTTGTLYFSAVGDISDNTDTLLSNNTWGAGTLYFYGGVTESISTNITNLTAAMNGAADLTITETNGISLTSVVTANGSITVSAAGAISAVLVDSSAVSNDANDITLTSTGAGISVTEVLGGAGQLNDVILDAQGGAITDNGSTGITGNVLTADAAGSITVVAAVDNADLQTSAAGNISVTETDNITLTLIEPNNGDVSITASGGNITVVDINDIAGTNQVALTASGTIDDGVAAAEVISAQTLALTAGTGITDLNIAVGTVGAETDTGNLTLIETDALVIGTVATVTGVTLVDSGNADAGAAISIQAGTGITFNQAVVNNDAGDITVSSTAGSLIDGTGTETALVNGATVTLNAVNGAIGGAGVLDIEVTAATALNGDTSTGGGDIYLQSIGNLPVGLVDAGTGDVSITGNGAVSDALADGASDIDAGALTISAANGIALDTAVTSLDLTNSTANAIDIDETDNVDVAGISQTGGGIVTLDTTAGDITVTVAGSGITGDGGQITLTAAVDINLGNNISNPAGNITLASNIIMIGDATVSSAGIGDIQFSGDIDADDNTVNDRMLQADSGTGNLQVIGDIGTAANGEMHHLDFDGADITLASIGSAAQNGVDGAAGTNIDVQSTGTIFLNGQYYKCAQNQRYFSTVYDVRIDLSGNGEIGVHGGGTTELTNFSSVFIDSAGDTIDFHCDLSVSRDFVLYNGTIDTNSHDITVIRDFVAFGSGANAGIPIAAAAVLDDPDTDAGDTDNDYPDRASLAYSVAPAYTGSLGDLGTSTIDVTGDFFVNGADLVNGDLDLQDVSGSDRTGGGWGSVYNVVLNATVDNTTVTAGVIAASSPSAVVNTVNNNNTAVANTPTDAETLAYARGFDFTAPRINTAQTVSDRVLEIAFTESLYNVNSEILASNILIDGETTAFDTIGTGYVTNTPNGALGVSAATLYLAELGTPVTWNSDATGTSAGDAAGMVSTDWDGTAQSVVPDVAIVKGDYYDLGGNKIANYSTATAAGDVLYTATADGCDPVLLAVYAGRENQDVADHRNFHNYFRLIYSEAVDLPTIAAGVNTAADGLRATSYTGSELGGYINGAGTVTVAGYFSYTGTVSTGTRDATSQTDAFYRLIGRDQEVEIVLTGYRDVTGLYQGYITSATDPVGAAGFSIVANTNITDAAGNSFSASDSTAAAILGEIDNTIGNAGWDVDPPQIAAHVPGGVASGYYEIVTKDTDLNTVTDRVEIHIFDCPVEDLSDYNGLGSSFDSDTDHPDVESLPGYPRGVRDNTLQQAGVSAAFGLSRSLGGGVNNLDPAVAFLTNVTDNGAASLFQGPVNTADDPYFSITFGEAGGFTDLDDIYLSYNSSGLITDLAGNLLQTATDLHCMERTPPRILYSLAVVGDDKIYVKFSEPVWNDALTSTDIIATDFTVTGFTVSSVTILSREIGGAKEAYLNLNANIVEDDIFTQTISMIVEDKVTNVTDIGVTHRISDIGLGVITPVWASDGLHDDSSYGGGFYTIRDFSGGGKVMDRDVTLEADILSTTAAGYGTTLILDADPPASTLVNGFWLPVLIPEFNPAANLNARALSSISTAGSLRDFLIPSGDVDMVAGKDLELLFKLGNLYCARSLDPEDPRDIAPWILPVRDLTRQTAGVTILNNVIKPSTGELAVLNYEVPETGMVTITVFGLDGDVVNTLQRGVQAAGEHTVTWDGTNRGGLTVARGIYFIRVVGPDFDEYRKVMIVK